MATYIVLANLTDQGIRSVKDSPKRAEAVKAAGEKLGVVMKSIHWTLGRYDLMVVCEATDDEAMTAFGLAIGMQGNVRSETLRAFNATEMGEILGRIG